MRDGKRIVFNGLFFNNEMAYETISDIELELEYFYDDNIRLFLIDCKTKIEECYQRLKNLINDITKIKVVEIEAERFIDNYPSIEKLISGDSAVKLDYILRQYEKDLLKLFSKKVEIIRKSD